LSLAPSPATRNAAEVRGMFSTVPIPAPELPPSRFFPVHGDRPLSDRTYPITLR
jgi:hypothetical protein